MQTCPYVSKEISLSCLYVKWFLCNLKMFSPDMMKSFMLNYVGQSRGKSHHVFRIGTKNKRCRLAMYQSVVYALRLIGPSLELSTLGCSTHCRFYKEQHWAPNLIRLAMLDCVYGWMIVWHVIIIFSSPGPKVHVNYCHHLASVVCRL